MTIAVEGHGGSVEDAFCLDLGTLFGEGVFGVHCLLIGLCFCHVIVIAPLYYIVIVQWICNPSITVSGHISAILLCGICHCGTRRMNRVNFDVFGFQSILQRNVE